MDANLAKYDPIDELPAEEAAKIRALSRNCTWQELEWLHRLALRTDTASIDRATQFIAERTAPDCPPRTSKRHIGADVRRTFAWRN